MTVPPPGQPAAISLSAATGIMLPDLVWHPLTGSLGAVITPAFTDPLHTGPDGGPAVIAPGDTWVQFVDAATGQAYAAPLRSVVAVKLGAPVALAIMPALVEAAEAGGSPRVAEHYAAARAGAR